MNKYYEFAKTNRLRQIRESKGVTQRSLALACSQTASKISCYERGLIMPRYDVIRAISRFLDVCVDEIYPEFKSIDERVDHLKKLKIL